MEESYGKSWVVPASSLISAVIVAITIYFELFRDWHWYPMLFAGLSFVIPGFMRFVICRKWKPVEAEIKSSKDLSRAYLSWRGASMAYSHEANIEYYVGEAVFRARITSTLPFKQSKTIFYDPIAPSVFTQNKGLGLHGLGFLLLVGLSIFKMFERR